MEQQIGLTRAIITSINRANGAADAGNSFWEAAQLQVANQYVGQLTGFISSEPELLTNLQSAIQAGGFPKVTVTTGAAFNFEFNVAFNGLPSSIAQPLGQLGADQATIDNVRELMIVQDVNLVAGTIPAKITDAGVVSSLQTLAQVLNPLA